MIRAATPELRKSGSKGRIMEAKTVAGSVIFMSRALMGLEDSAGTNPRRTARKPTPMRRKSPTRLENRTDRFVRDHLFYGCSKVSRRQVLPAALGRIQRFLKAVIFSLLTKARMASF